MSDQLDNLRVEVDKIFKSIPRKVGTVGIDYTREAYWVELRREIGQDAMQFFPILIWCEEQFRNNWVWNFNVLYFKYQKDQVFFAMKWSSLIKETSSY